MAGLHTPFFDMHATTGLLVTVMLADKSPLTEHEKRWLSQVTHPALSTKEASPSAVRKWFRSALQNAVSPALKIDDLVKLYAKQLRPEFRSSVLDLVMEGAMIQESEPGAMPSTAKDRAVDLLCREWSIPEEDVKRRAVPAAQRALMFVQNDDIGVPLPNNHFKNRSQVGIWLGVATAAALGVGWYLLR